MRSLATARRGGRNRNAVSIRVMAEIRANMFDAYGTPLDAHASRAWIAARHGLSDAVLLAESS
jgi:hypothetical protein